MPKKTLKWWMRTPGATVRCPWCGKDSYVQIQFGVNTKETKAYKVTKKVVSKHDGDEGTNGPDEEQA